MRVEMRTIYHHELFFLAKNPLVTAPNKCTFNVIEIDEVALVVVVKTSKTL